MLEGPLKRIVETGLVRDQARELNAIAIRERKWDGDADQQLTLMDSTDSVIPSRSQLRGFAACSVSE